MEVHLKLFAVKEIDMTTTNHPNDLGRLRFPLDDVSIEEYPVPWDYIDRGNGHTDVLDAQNRVFANVYCFKDSDFDVVVEWIEKHNAKI